MAAAALVLTGALFPFLYDSLLNLGGRPLLVLAGRKICSCLPCSHGGY